MMKFASILFFASCASAVYNDLTLGSGVHIELDASAETPTCVATIEVPAEAAGANCQIEINSEKGAQFLGTDLIYNYMWKKDSTAFVETDKLTYTDGDDQQMAAAPCATAGTYYLGLTVQKCSACLLGTDSSSDITAIAKIDGAYNVWWDGSTEMQTAQVTMNETDWMMIHFSLNETSTPHFDIDKSATSIVDNYDYFWVPKGKDLTVEADRTEVDPSSSNSVILTDQPAGDYVLGIHVASVQAGSATSFHVELALNKSPSGGFPDGACAATACDLSLKCSDCTEDSCNWCETTRTCTADACPDNEAAVTDSAQCFDIAAECDKDQYDSCGACASRAGCVWCNSGGSVIDTGSCSAGKSDEGRECTSALATAVTDVAQCDDVGTKVVTKTIIKTVPMTTDASGNTQTGSARTVVETVTATEYDTGTPASSTVLSALAVVLSVVLFL